jgi:hypothetical protein
VSDSPTFDCCDPNSCCSRSTPKVLGGSTATRPLESFAMSNVRANSRGVTAASAPTDRPDLSRPVTLAAVMMVVLFGMSTKSPRAEPCADAPMRRL